MNTQLFHQNVERVAVAMSGGVDSSVAALILQRAGYACVGISMQLWDYRQHGGCAHMAACSGPDRFTDARSVSAAIGIPYHLIDLEQIFKREVVDTFVHTYRIGETPNPCVDCNRRVKFGELRNRARTFGCSHVATGHYARIEQRSDGLHLLRARDRRKDQSYFLFTLTQGDLAKTIFPVGDFTKVEVRKMAGEAGLVTASKAESQDICFLSGSVGQFLTSMGVETRGGDIVLRDGTIVGAHPGIEVFTVGQRKGIHAGGAAQPLYVLEIEPESRRVIVGRKEELERAAFSVGELSWAAPARPPEAFSAVAQVRHRHAGVPVDVRVADDGSVRVSFVKEWAAVAPGQACVFYDQTNNEVLGGGRILRGKS